MNTSIKRHLEAIISWTDKGFDKGAKTSMQRLDAIKRAARELMLALAALVGVLTGLGIALLKAVEAGSKIQDQIETWDRVREHAGLLPDTLHRIVEATRGVVSNQDIMRLSASALNDELEPGRLVEFWAKARQISEASGRPVAQVFEMLYLAVAKGQTRMLTQIGITLDVEEATAKYAAAIGREVSELTFRDRQLAVSMALEEKYIKQFKSLGELGGDNAEKFDQFKTKLVNLKDKFLVMLATSPAVEKFLNFLLEKVKGLEGQLTLAEPKIKAVVDQLARFYEGFIAFASEKAGPAIENIYKYRDAIAALAVVVGTGVVASKIMGLGVALGLVTGGTAAAVIGLATAIAGAGAATYVATKDTQGMNEALSSMAMASSGGAMGLSMAMRQARDEVALTGSFLDDLIAKQSALGMAPFKVPTPGAVDTWGGGQVGRTPVTMPEKFDRREKLALIGEMYDERVEIVQGATDKMKAISLNYHEYEVELMHRAIENTMREAQLRTEVWQRTWSVMESYSARYQRRQVSMGRAVNAALVAGYYEATAAYIDAKTSQAKIDVLQYGYYMLADIAHGRFYTIPLWSQAIAGAAVLAGAGMVASAYMRSEGSRRAEEIAGQGYDASGNGSAEADGSGGSAKRRQATGIINTRPIAVNVYSTANFNAGYMIFGDSESAAEDLYTEQIRDKIANDVESGMIAIPA